jgi:hypothetical protein
MFAGSRFKDRAGELGIQSAREDAFDRIALTVVPKFHSVRKLFRFGGSCTSP